MITNIKQTSVPADVVTVSEAKLHCRVDHSTEDAIFTRLIGVARRQCEQISGWAFTTRTYTAQLDYWPLGNCIELPYPPLQSVTSIEYIDGESNELEFDNANYIVDTHSTPGRIVLKEGVDWPDEKLQIAAGITITFVAGFGNAAAVPDQYKQAMLLLIGHLYENRESIVVQQGVSQIQIPQSVEWLLLTDRVC